MHFYCFSIMIIPTSNKLLIVQKIDELFNVINNNSEELHTKII